MLHSLRVVHADTPEEQIYATLEFIYAKSPTHTIDEIFQLRDPNGGGNKEQFRVCMRWLILNDPDAALLNMQRIPKHGTYKDVLMCAIDTPLEHKYIKFYVDTLKSDLENLRRGVSITTAAKYAPTNKCVSYPRRYLDRFIAEMSDIGITTKALYRKQVLRPLRDALAKLPLSVYSAIHNGSVNMTTLIPPRELVSYYLAGRPYNQCVEQQWMQIVEKMRQEHTCLRAPRPELAHVLAHSILFIELNVNQVLIATTRYTTFDATQSLEAKVREMLRIYDPRGTYVKIGETIYDLGLKHMLLDTYT